MPSSTPSGDAPIFCLVEDRPGAEIGVKLLILSLAEGCSHPRAVLFLPEPTDGFRRWLQSFPWVELRTERLRGAGSCVVKPSALLALLDQGHPDVVWLDTDLLALRDPQILFAGMEPDGVGMAQEIRSASRQGTECRTRGWGMEVGRTLPFTLSSCILRVTPRHRELVLEWRRLMESDDFTRHLEVPMPVRPIHAMGDQDVLNALLGSKAWAGLPLRVFPLGEAVAHCGGAVTYSVGERLGHLFGKEPVFLHSLSSKPWQLLDPDWIFGGTNRRYRELMQELSPYLMASRRYRDRLEDPCRWMDHRTVPGTLLRWMGLGNRALTGLPVAVFGEAVRWFVGCVRRSVP